jgi:hypothetical protein
MGLDSSPLRGVQWTLNDSADRVPSDTDVTGLRIDRVRPWCTLTSLGCGIDRTTTSIANFHCFPFCCLTLPLSRERRTSSSLYRRNPARRSSAAAAC